MTNLTVNPIAKFLKLTLVDKFSDSLVAGETIALTLANKGGELDVSFSDVCERRDDTVLIRNADAILQWAFAELELDDMSVSLPFGYQIEREVTTYCVEGDWCLNIVVGEFSDDVLVPLPSTRRKAA